MAGEDKVNERIRTFIEQNEAARTVVFRVLLKMHAVQQYCDREGIDQTTVTAAEHRCPFLLNILEACGLVDTDTRRVTVKKLALAPFLVAPYTREEASITEKRLQSVYAAWPTSDTQLSPEDISIVRELFGREFLTAGYFLQDLMIIED